ncbi:NAD-glutamate dehydrogenase domain-containing protein [Candidatus Legionella polyplacis]|uniref:NAD-glutamate dehydrogenase n=1 Tax=Candidatus Legionella polyplacis TaxID=2005262 RepID=A0ABZ2H092_9GAMM
MKWNLTKIEKEFIDLKKIWINRFKYFLDKKFNKEKVNFFYKKYRCVFPLSYIKNVLPKSAVEDIQFIELLSKKNLLLVNFNKFLNKKKEYFYFKLYKFNDSVILSNILYIIKNFGLQIFSGQSYLFNFGENKNIWISHLILLNNNKNVKVNMYYAKRLIQDAFRNIYLGYVENDSLNKLILSANLSWRKISILRMYAKYFKQTKFIFNEQTIKHILNHNIFLTKYLIKLFRIRFKPNINNRKYYYKLLLNDIHKYLSKVTDLTEDRVIRQYVQAIIYTLRTNYYQYDSFNKKSHKNYISIKLDSKNIPYIPKPYPFCEIFVYSVQFEGIHLRGGKISRGGIRWSDRKKDFRTEILGLMKTQQIKNSLIIPSGAKGGFIIKEIQCGVIDCYKSFIKGMLDITDNYKDGNIVHPVNVVCFDEYDPYLVVAADKGTSNFSDVANEISYKYSFWLGDAFASGGSNGYNHKKIGITAKGAWESIKSNFYEINLNINNDYFTVVGIGDMSGDVFGNGMLLSNKIHLLGAFNHIHIFIDPNPNAEISFEERKRLFYLPHSTWKDYNINLISKGGGVFDRSEKFITVSKEMKKVFNINNSVIEPNDLIKILLKSKVDFLWSAGIGTFVKSSYEDHTDVNDKINDLIRIDGKDLKCKIVGEGGNLGLTQLARIEYALNGGLIYTDFIDNVAGVHCSDKEVNIKILLDNINCRVANNERNDLLSSIENEVVLSILKNHNNQLKIINILYMQSSLLIDLHSDYIDFLEIHEKFERNLYFLPDKKCLLKRKIYKKGLLKPEISILISYSKILLKKAILELNINNDLFFNKILLNYFPSILQKKYSKYIIEYHPLRREIISTKLSNLIINDLGFSFIYQIKNDTGSSIDSIIYAYLISKNILNFEKLWKKIETLDSKLNFGVKYNLYILQVRLLYRVIRWILENHKNKNNINIDLIIEHYRYKLSLIKMILLNSLLYKELLNSIFFIQNYISLGISQSLLNDCILLECLVSFIDIIYVEDITNINIGEIIDIYLYIEKFLKFNWLRNKILSYSINNYLDYLIREEFLKDIQLQQRKIVIQFIYFYKKNKKDLTTSLNQWINSNSDLINNWKGILSKFKINSVYDFNMIFMFIRKLFTLTDIFLKKI